MLSGARGDDVSTAREPSVTSNASVDICILILTCRVIRAPGNSLINVNAYGNWGIQCRPKYFASSRVHYFLSIIGDTHLRVLYIMIILG